MKKQAIVTITISVTLLDFQTDFYINNKKQNKNIKEMNNIELLGYQLIKISKNQYDASVVGRHEPIADIVDACIQQGLDIVYYGDGKLILEE